MIKCGLGLINNKECRMKKIICFLLLGSTYLLSNSKEEPRFSTALTAGYVFKNQSSFKNVYGPGVANAITADLCYYFYHNWGLGTKVSYWLNRGKTTLLKERSDLQEVPLTFYLRKAHYFDCNLGLYLSLGGGVIWLKEKSYLGSVNLTKGIGEVEIGLNYTLWRFIGLTGAFRYLFPNQSQHHGNKVEVGGLELRAGLVFSF